MAFRIGLQEACQPVVRHGMLICFHRPVCPPCPIAYAYIAMSQYQMRVFLRSIRALTDSFNNMMGSEIFSNSQLHEHDHSNP